MHASASAYAALGLEPGADRAAVEDAYRRLIKIHHPDRSGGDSSRAAEINRAYHELRRQTEIDRSHAPVPSPSAPRRSSAARRSRRKSRRRESRRSDGRLWPVLVLSVAILMVIERERLIEQAPRWIGWLADIRPGLPSGRGSAVAIDSSALDGPLVEPAITRSINQAVSLVQRGDEDQLAAQSRNCHRRLRSEPGLAQLDRCAAFDDAVVALADRDPLNDRGAFSASAVTARQMTAASLLSRDYLAIERRLDRIRMTVQLALRQSPLPPPPLPPPPLPAPAAAVDPPADLATADPGAPPAGDPR